MIIDGLKRFARDKGDSLALAFHKTSDAEPTRLTWQALWDRAARLATALLGEFSPLDRVLLIFPQGIEFHVCQLACNYAGLVPIPVPLPTNISGEERVQTILRDSDCVGILALDNSIQELQPIAGDVRVLAIQDLETRPLPAIAPPIAASDGDAAFIQYTSGSVGTPKGVVVTHANLNSNVRMMTSGRIQPTNVFVSWVPHFHDMGLVGNFYVAMHLGGELHLMDPATFVRRPLSWLRLISSTRATSTAIPHFALGLCTRFARSLSPGEIDLSSMRLIVDSSEPVDWEGVNEFERAFAPFGLAPGTVVPHYGLAECTVMVSYPDHERPRYIDIDRQLFSRGVIERCDDKDRSQRMVNAGRGKHDCVIAIVDPETRRACPPDRVGEIWVSGSHVALGYWGGPDATASVFNQRIIGEKPGNDTSDAVYLRTGDLGFIHDGDLFVTGRMKDVIIVRGQNYYARDIESLAEDVSPLIRDGRVVAIACESREGEGVGLLAEVAPKFDYRTHALEIASGFAKSLSERLGLTAQTLALVQKNTLPRTTSGKIRRRDASGLYRSGRLASVFEYEAANFSAPDLGQSGFPGLQDRAPLRDWLLQLLLARAGVEEIGDDEDLFTLGVDSLSMTNLLLEIEDSTQRSLLVEEFYSDPTITTLLNILMADEKTNQPDAPAQSDPVTAQSTQRERSLRQRLGFWLRDQGPGLGSMKLSYGFGSRLLERALASKAIVNRLSRPYNHYLEKFIAQNDLEDPEELRRDFARGFVWSGWRELCLMNPETFERHVTVKGAERIKQARARGQGVIVAIVHSRSKGLYKMVPEIREAPLIVIGNLRPDRAAFFGLGDLAYASGATPGNYVPATRVAQIHKAHSVLREGGTVAIFMDYFDGVGGIKVPILGRRRTIRPGIAELALETNSVIIAAEHWLHANGKVTIEFKEPFVERGDTREERGLSLMIQQAAALEDMWRTNPAQMDAEAMAYQMVSFDP